MPADPCKLWTDSGKPQTPHSPRPKSSLLVNIRSGTSSNMGGAQVDFSPAACTSPLGTAAVVDGAQILITPLRHTVIPPPMAAAVMHTSELGLEAPGVACMAIRAARADLPEVGPGLQDFQQAPDGQSCRNSWIVLPREYCIELSPALHSSCI